MFEIYVNNILYITLNEYSSALYFVVDWRRVFPSDIVKLVEKELK